MPRDGRVFLDDIAAACRKIGRYASSLSFEQFREDEKTVDAVLRNLEVIGEAAKKLPAPMREKIEGIDWSRIAGLRDVLIHDYFTVDLEIIWDIVRNKVPELQQRVDAYLDRRPR